MCRFLVLIAFAALVASPVHAQRRRPEPLRDPAADLTVVRDLARAAREQLALTPTPGDANGELRAWDRRWRVAMEAVPVITRYRGGCTVSLPASRLRWLRDDIGRHPTNAAARTITGEQVALELAAARWQLEDAVRRLRDGHTCEDQPSQFQAGFPDLGHVEGCRGSGCARSPLELLEYAETGVWPARAEAAVPSTARGEDNTSGTGLLSLVTIPAATVRIDGAPAGITPLRVTLPVGSHVVELRDEEGREKSITVEISRGETTRQRIDF